MTKEDFIEVLDKYDSNFNLETGEKIQAIYFYDFGKLADELVKLFATPAGGVEVPLTESRLSALHNTAKQYCYTTQDNSPTISRKGVELLLVEYSKGNLDELEERDSDNEVTDCGSDFRCSKCGEYGGGMVFKSGDCTNCTYFTANQMSYPSGKCKKHGLETGIGKNCPDFNSR